MRILLFAKRNTKEVLRDPINFFFGLGFPLVLLVLLSIIVGTGLLFGSLMNEKAVGGVCGALLTNVAGWLSGVFIPIDLIGGTFKTITHILPFYHSVEAIRVALSGNFSQSLSHLAVVMIYTVVIFVLAIVVFQRKMNGVKE